VDLLHRLEQQILQGRMEIAAHDHAVDGGEHVDVLGRPVIAEIDQSPRQHDVGERRCFAAYRVGLLDVHDLNFGRREGACDHIAFEGTRE
jgi:hypothetical protein